MYYFSKPTTVHHSQRVQTLIFCSFETKGFGDLLKTSCVGVHIFLRAFSSTCEIQQTKRISIKGAYSLGTAYTNNCMQEYLPMHSIVAFEFLV